MGGDGDEEYGWVGFWALVGFVRGDGPCWKGGALDSILPSFLFLSTSPLNLFTNPTIPHHPNTYTYN